MASLSASAMSGPTVKEIEVNRARLQYVEQGSGEPIVFVHGTLSGLNRSLALVRIGGALNLDARGECHGYTF